MPDAMHNDGMQSRMPSSLTATTAWRELGANDVVAHKHSARLRMIMVAKKHTHMHACAHAFAFAFAYTGNETGRTGYLPLSIARSVPSNRQRLQCRRRFRRQQRVTTTICCCVIGPTDKRPGRVPAPTMTNTDSVGYGVESIIRAWPHVHMRMCCDDSKHFI